MKLKRAALASAVGLALGAALALPQAASAAVATGNYNMIINNTPYTTKALFGSEIGRAHV